MFPIDKLYHMDANNDNSSQKESNNDNNFAYELWATKKKDKKKKERKNWNRLEQASQPSTWCLNFKAINYTFIMCFQHFAHYGSTLSW